LQAPEDLVDDQQQQQQHVYVTISSNSMKAASGCEKQVRSRQSADQ
jgi:hypothetical protein